MANLFDQARVGVYWFFNRENGQATIKLDPKSGIFDLGGQTVNGRLRINDANDRTAFDLNAATRTLDILDEAGNVTFRLNGLTGRIETAEQVRAAVTA